MKLYRTLAMAALLAVGAVGSSFAGTDTKTAKPAHKVATAAVRYECAHCNVKMSAKDAKAHGYKCPDCGMKMTVVKKPTKMDPKAKKA